MSLPYKIPLKGKPELYESRALREEEEEQPRKSGPSRHSESTREEDAGGIDIGG